jgi:hypothetical protein
MLRSVALIATFTFCLGSAPQVAAGTNDEAQIYGTFLDGWAGKNKDPINVSKTAKAPSAEELKEFSDCAQIGAKAHWTTVQSIDDLTNYLVNLPYVRLVNPDKWHPSDPGDLMAQGKSVDAAVESGISQGLLTLSTIAFDETRGTAAFTYSFECGRLCGNGGTIIFKKTKGAWLKSNKQCGGWMSYIRSRGPNNSFNPTAGVGLVISNQLAPAAG